MNIIQERNINYPVKWTEDRFPAITPLSWTDTLEQMKENLTQYFAYLIQNGNVITPTINTVDNINTKHRHMSQNLYRLFGSNWINNCNGLPENVKAPKTYFVLDKDVKELSFSIADNCNSIISSNYTLQYPVVESLNNYTLYTDWFHGTNIQKRQNEEDIKTMMNVIYETIGFQDWGGANVLINRNNEIRIKDCEPKSFGNGVCNSGLGWGNKKNKFSEIYIGKTIRTHYQKLLNGNEKLIINIDMNEVKRRANIN